MDGTKECTFRFREKYTFVPLLLDHEILLEPHDHFLFVFLLFVCVFFLPDGILLPSIWFCYCTEFRYRIRYNLIFSFQSSSEDFHIQFFGTPLHFHFRSGKALHRTCASKRHLERWSEEYRRRATRCQPNLANSIKSIPEPQRATREIQVGFRPMAMSPAMATFPLHCYLRGERNDIESCRLQSRGRPG